LILRHSRITLSKLGLFRRITITKVQAEPPAKARSSFGILFALFFLKLLHLFCSFDLGGLFT
jgi:hypothetical protein